MVTKKIAKKPRKIAQKSVSRGMSNAYSTLHGQYTGYHSRVVHVASRQVEAVGRSTQFLTHFASALKTWYSSLPKKSEIEIQIALVDEQYFVIASNKDQTAYDLYDEFAKKQALDFTLESMAGLAVGAASRSTAGDSYRNARQAGKLSLEIKGDRAAPQKAMDALKKQGIDACVQFNATDDIGDEFGKFLSGKMPGKFVAIVTSTAFEMHAEQKTLLAMAKASRQFDANASAIFAGTFRPCRGCFESLSVMKKYYMPNLAFGSRPGHFWRTTNRAHVEIFNNLVNHGYISVQQRDADFDADGLLIGLTNTSHRPSLRPGRGLAGADSLHYATDSDSDMDSEDDA